MFDLNNSLRNNIRFLKPYTSARDEYKGNEGVFLDANENSFGSATSDLYNRYPDPLQSEMKNAISNLKGCKENQIFVGNGSDEAIDLLFRCFCNPGIDNVIITPPTYGMYEVSANINDINLKRVWLNADFSLDENQVLKTVDLNTKMIILCSPNNPTGNCISTTAIEKILTKFDGIVVIDEAYIDFAPNKSFLPKLNQFSNLVVLHTFSKAWGLANLRLGLAFASKEIIYVLNKIKPPYNISGLSQKIALEALKNSKIKEKFVENILLERENLKSELEKLSFVIKVYPSDANFLLVKTTNGSKIYNYLITKKVILRDRSNVKLCEECLRITVGTHHENSLLVSILNNYK